MTLPKRVFLTQEEIIRLRNDCDELILTKEELQKEFFELSKAQEKSAAYFIQHKAVMDGFLQLETHFWLEVENRVNDLQEIVAKLKWELADLSRRRQRASSDMVELLKLEKENNALDSSKTDLRTELERLKAVSDQLRRKVDARQIEVREEISQFERLIRQRKEDVGALQDENKKLEDLVIQAMRRRDFKKRELENMEAEIKCKGS